MLQEVDFWGNILTTRYALEHLRRTNGQVVVTCSVGAFVPYPKQAFYNVSFLWIWFSIFFAALSLLHVKSFSICHFMCGCILSWIKCISSLLHVIGIQGSTPQFLWYPPSGAHGWKRCHYYRSTWFRQIWDDNRGTHGMWIPNLCVIPRPPFCHFMSFPRGQMCSYHLCV